MKKGFTLIELLAVVVVLAVVAIIAIPIMLNVIDKAKQGAAESSALGYIDAIEKYIMLQNVDSTKHSIKLESNNTYEVSGNDTSKTYLNDIINIKGTKPTSGEVTIDNKNRVTHADFVIDEYSIECEKKKCVVEGTLHKVTLNAEGNLSNNQIYLPHNAKLNNLPEPIKDGHEFLGWYYDNNYNNIVNENNKIKDDLQLYAKYRNCGDPQPFEYTGNVQTFTATCNGKYRVELWGAQGGSGTGGNSPNITVSAGYNGGYTGGTIELTEGEQLYVVVGGKGANYNAGAGGGYNGGGTGNRSNMNYAGGGGGGATDIRYGGTTVYNRIMVAVGGTGARGTACGGIYGGARNGASAGTQFSGYSFGTGMNGYQYHAGGAGAYWTGKDASGEYAIAGGSSFISGHTGCVAIAADNSTTPRNDSNNVACNSSASAGYNATGYNTDPVCSIHFSGKYFTDTKMYDYAGHEWTISMDSVTGMMPTHDGTSTMTGNTGNGYAKITYLGK